MTNKESIQAAHLEAIHDISADVGTWGDYGGINTESKKEAATSCTTITAEAIKDYEEWKGVFIGDDERYYTTPELIELFLNQKAKI